MLGIGVSLRTLRSSVSSGAIAVFTPADLFANGEEGAWYEPSPTTAFLSTNDLTPCGVGDACGFLLDKSQGAGYSGGSFTGVSETEQVTNGTFDTDVSGWSASSGKTISWSSNELFMEVVSAASGGAVQSLTTEVGKTYYFSCTARRSAGTNTGVLLQVRSSATWPGSFLAGAETTSATNETISFAYTATSTTTYLWLAGGTDVEGYFDNISVRELPGNHATQATLASRPILRQTGGGLYYLEFDGTDDALQTAAIDFSASDEMSVFFGLEKESDAATGISLELSDLARDGSFTLTAPPGDLTGYFWRTRGDGTPTAINTATPAAPVTNVLTGTGDISADEMELRIDGVSAGTSAADQGAGNFGNWPLYIGARGGTSAFFDGKVYSLIVRGATTSGDDLTNAESYVADKTGVTL